MGGVTKLVVPIGKDAGLALMNLARRCNVTYRIIGEEAIRHLFVAAQAGALPELPPLDPGFRGGATIWLDDADLATLKTLAEVHGTTPAIMASLALRHMLAKARDGVLPMIKPIEEAPPPELPSWEELHASSNRWDAKYLSDPDDLPEEKPLRPARINFSKALFTIERLERLHAEGINTKTPRAALDEIDALASVRPLSEG